MTIYDLKNNNINKHRAYKCYSNTTFVMLCVLIMNCMYLNLAHKIHLACIANS